MQIGNYSLGQQVRGDVSLTEISSQEYTALPKTFVSEKILRAQDVTFLDRRWNLLLGTIDGQVYKLSAQFLSESSQAADAAFSESVAFCSAQFGAPSGSAGGLGKQWDTAFGNVIVDRQSALAVHCVNLQSTSCSLVRSATLVGEESTRPGAQDERVPPSSGKPPRAAPAARLAAWAVMTAVAFAVSKTLGAFVLFLGVGGSGKKWFQENAYFYTRAAAVINGVLWGAVLGGLYIALTRLLRLQTPLSIMLLLWGALAAAYSGYGAGPVPFYMQDGSHANLALIRRFATAVFLGVAFAAIWLTER